MTASPLISSPVARSLLQVTLQQDARYDQSVLWQLQDAWFAKRGIAAWTERDIPHRATCNQPFARQCAELITALVAEHEAAGALGNHEPVWLLELGSGHGLFAVLFLRALAQGCGKAGRALLPRLRYLLSDYAATNVEQAVAAEHSQELAAHVKAGRVVPALYDVREPEQIRDLEGKPLEAPLLATLANYVCCVTPTRVLRKQSDTWFEKHVRVGMELPGGNPAFPYRGAELIAQLLQDPLQPSLLEGLQVEPRFAQVSLEEVFVDPTLAACVTKTLAPLERAVLRVPELFFLCLRGLERLSRPGALALVSDYGNCNLEQFGDADVPPQHYGGSLNHGLDFPLFDAVAAAQGWPCERSAVESRRLHTLALRYGMQDGIGNAEGERLARFWHEFRRLFADSAPGEDLLDFNAAARHHANHGEYPQAIRLYERALRIDPDNAELRLQLGAACNSAGRLRAAERHLERGRLLPGADEAAFEFERGRALAGLGRPVEAIAAYERSAKLHDSPLTSAHLGALYRGQNELKMAAHHLRTALKLEPTLQDAKTLLAEVEAAWLALL